MLSTLSFGCPLAMSMPGSKLKPLTWVPASAS